MERIRGEENSGGGAGIANLGRSLFLQVGMPSRGALSPGARHRPPVGWACTSGHRRRAEESRRCAGAERPYPEPGNTTLTFCIRSKGLWLRKSHVAIALNDLARLRQFEGSSSKAAPLLDGRSNLAESLGPRHREPLLGQANLAANSPISTGRRGRDAFPGFVPILEDAYGPETLNSDHSEQLPDLLRKETPRARGQEISKRARVLRKKRSRKVRRRSNHRCRWREATRLNPG